MVSYVREAPDVWQHYVQEGARNTAQSDDQSAEELIQHYTQSRGRRGVTGEAKEGQRGVCFRRSQGHGIYWIKAKTCRVTVVAQVTEE